MSKKTAPQKLTIGQELWRYTWPNTLHYKVIGVREYEGSTQYEVECLSCKHGKLCRVLIARDDYGHLETVHMLNNDEDDDQRAWHTKDDLSGYYHTTIEACKLERFSKAIKRTTDKLEQARKNVTQLELDLAELNNAKELLGVA